MRNKNNSFEGLEASDDRAWSDDQGYLDTLAGLINRAHEASMDAGQDVYDWFFILEQWQLEIIGQLIIRGFTTELAELKKLRSDTRIKIDKAYQALGNRVGSLSSADASTLRNYVYPYHELLSVLTHKMDLRLHQVKPKAYTLAVEDDY